ncbi:MAG: TerC family protein, partial [Phycisphaerales bacterium]
YSHDWLGIGTRYRTSLESGTLVAAGQPPTADGTPTAPVMEPKRYTDHRLGMRAAGEFFAGWLTEYSLSVDNIFVISLLFTFFSVPAKYQHRVLFWGILGALVMRGIMIGLGNEVVKRYEWVLLLFGAFLVVQGLKLLKPSDEQFDPEKSRVIRMFRRVMPVTSEYHEQRFFVRLGGRLFATPL